MFRHRWYRGAWARPNGEGRVDWRGGSIIGPSLFWFFLGQCQKEQTPLPAMINQSPIPHN
ncbi:MAG: hypothetical protein AVDCRST_MAG56-2757 [uncultured Cytophagales bacterium]|uniref:Uncharacterized protein n=1 Tax=uncultured Cytophagales bacterium TaxID=158755 RepID=A0A6J4J1W1_9SPHI|nr:MAG: hypothetical protein AVDCRST_MAG56-2757 [uncultured Cytophagales bacterium]